MVMTMSALDVQVGGDHYKEDLLIELEYGGDENAV